MTQLQVRPLPVAASLDARGPSSAMDADYSSPRLCAPENAPTAVGDPLSIVDEAVVAAMIADRASRFSKGWSPDSAAALQLPPRRRLVFAR